ncbi:MAG: tRNA pseudouridine(55) synthase TruB [Thermoleophilaceae bacterium]
MAAPRSVNAPGDGVILFDKPAGKTSHDVVAAVRRGLPRGVKVGHAGTLDPFATGLLLVLVGRAARLQRYLLGLPKAYRVVARLGWKSDTGDRDGALEHTGNVPEALSIPTGEQTQRPPAYSAVRVGGERLYKKARRGEGVEGEPRLVTIHSAELVERKGELATFDIECSAGTYVRQLVAGLGDAYCQELRRTAIGAFCIEDADPDRALTPGEALGFMPARELGAEDALRVSHGVKLALEADEEPAAGALALMHEGRLVAVAEPRGRQLAPVVVFGA